MLLPKQNRWLPFIRRTQQFFESALFRHANRPRVLRMNDADRPPQRGVSPLDVFIAPSERCPHRFLRIALPVHSRSEHPAHFRDAFQLRLDLSLPIREPHLSRETSGRFLFHDPISKSQPRPVSHAPQRPSPSFLLRQRLAANIPGHYRIAPHRRAIRKILRPMLAQPQPLRLNHRHFQAARTKSVMLHLIPKFQGKPRHAPYLTPLPACGYKFSNWHHFVFPSSRDTLKRWEFCGGFHAGWEHRTT